MTVDGVLPRGKQGFSNSMLLSFYTRSFLVSGAVLGFGEMFSSIPGPYPGNPYPYPRSTPSSSCDNPKCLQILPDCLQVGNWGPLCLYKQMRWLPSCYSNWVPLEGFPGGASGDQAICQCRCKRHGFDPRVGKIPWRRKWQPTLGFLLGKSHEQRSLESYDPRGCKESDTTEWLSTHSLTCSPSP